MMASGSTAKIQRQLASLDDAAFEALASRGLVRRARKDLESAAPPAIFGEGEGRVQVRIGEFEVSLPESGPSHATCSCPAAGICQHILAACLWLREQSADAADSNGAQAEQDDLLAVTPVEMEKWAGRAAVRGAISLAAQSETEISTEGAVTVNFRFLNATCRFVPGGGLDGAIVTGSPKDAKRLVLAALLVFQKSRGCTWPEFVESTAAVLAEGSGAPRSREEVLASAKSLLCDTVRAGLAHVTPASPERFATLSVSAVAVNLPRLSLLLRALAVEFRSFDDRDAHADASRAFSATARAYALCEALDRAGANAPAELVGWQRTPYGEVGTLELVGVAAWPWETPSGYRGLTVLFWDSHARAWNSWSEARPSHQDPSYDAIARFAAGGPWNGADSPRQVSRSRFRLLQARRSAMGRLSASSKSLALVTGPAVFHELNIPVATNWSELEEAIKDATPLGLKDSNPLNLIRVIRPAAWGRREFDQTTQTLIWLLYDEGGRALKLVIHYSELEEPAIKALEALVPSAGTALVGRISRTREGLSIYPFTLLSTPDGTANHMIFDAKEKKAPRTNPEAVVIREGEIDEEIEDDGVAETDQTTSRAEQLLAGLEGCLISLAEGGANSLSARRREELSRIQQRAESLGWRLLPAELKQLVASPSLEPQRLLRCQYICSLLRGVHGGGGVPSAAASVKREPL